MSQSIEVLATAREAKGSANSRRLRHANGVPAVVYGAGKASENINLDHLQLIAHLDREAFYSQILSLNLDGKKEKVVLKALQRHPYKAQILHVDFMRVKSTEVLTMKVPLHFMGEEEAPGVKDNGVISHTITELAIKCLPANLPEFIEVDVSKLELGGVIHLSDIKLPANVEMAHPVVDEGHDHPVVSLHLPKVQAEDRSVEAEEDALSAEAEAELKAEDDTADKNDQSKDKNRDDKA
ncbi:MAG: 50S ribosomal protein L25/general stress protein Ctc [Gammaproteobacteria bacterium RIFCSPHIGHO2_12_FULL_41_15]|nr:MAG: 50S ribosomal protein L25/general stress protein Ctc [Gammaproteobacteria bacterium RIFCSPHIGHO2_12_FULL_41_15]